MQMPVIVGVILAIMVVVTFSGWFYNLATGMNELVLDDAYFTYRIIAASLASMAFLVGVFFVIATIHECPNQERIGIFAGIKCDSYLKLKASADNLFQPKDEVMD